jgi:hypothetical protein
MSNAADVAVQEAAQVRANMASNRYDQAATQLAHNQATRKPSHDLNQFGAGEASYLAARHSTITGGRGGVRGQGGRGHGGHVSVSNSRVQALEAMAHPNSDAWTPVKLKPRKTKSPVSTYICADSGASRDLFVQQEWFVEYEDIQDQGKFVVVADDTRVPIMGVGSVRFNLGGHEVLLRRVFHVPGLNGSLLSIRTH